MAETYSAGIVTAYGAAVRGGYTGTYEEFCAEQASFAENAKQVGEDREAMETLAAQFSGTTVPAAVQTVQNAGAAQIQAVEAASETEQQQIAAQGAGQETRVTQAGSDQVAAVQAAGETQVGNVNTAGTTQVGNVNAAGTTQVNAVNAKGQEVIDSIPEDYTDLTEDVSSLKSAFNYISETGNITVSHNLTWQNGYVGATGLINSSSVSGYAIVPLEAGETVRIGTKNTNIAIISTTTESSLSVGDTVTPVKITTNVDTFQTYEYTAASPVNVVLCVRLSDFEVSFFKKTNLVTKSEISNIIGLEKSIVYGGSLFSGTVTAATGEFAATGVWRCTDYFQIPFVSGSKMTFTCTIYPGSDYGVAFYDYNKKYLTGIGASNASEWGITPSTTRIQTQTIVIPKNAAYIRTSILSSSVSPSVFVFAGVTLGDIVNRVINLECATQFSHIKPMNLLVLGDSYSAQRRWIDALMGYFGNDSNYITLAVTGATVKDQSNDRITYPYTSRPTSSGGTNQNTISCQIAKLERLMAGVDLDEGETQIYASEDDYPNVIIIEGGQNDFRDNDSTVETYFDQFEVAVDNVYIKQTASSEASVGVASVRPNIETINRTCFAGAYRYAIEKLMGIFPNAQIYITTVSDISYRKNYAVTKVRYKIAEQQIQCARMASVTVIDWYANGQMSVLNNTLTGSGTQADPYIVGGATEDTLDSLHPNDRGAAKLGQVAAKAIYSNWMDIE